MMFEAAYKMLRVDRRAGPEEIRRAYLRLVRRYPPEHFPEKFRQVHDAYRCLNLQEDALEDLAERLGRTGSPLETAAVLFSGRIPAAAPPAELDVESLAALLGPPETSEQDRLLDGLGGEE